ncbi:prepilin-type N-terminal cleavage/methylation domain-containing protein [Vibrio sp. FNV 38]|nr:prepilin-type N-terminal cleavage/methylation domain-containing protein [Vibrio sp. FNV 38]
MKARGFTLIEMIISIIIVAIIALGITGFVDFGTRGFAQTVERQKLHTQAQFVLQKLSRELRHAVPNSIDINGDCFSFYPIKYSGFYHVTGISLPYQLDFISGQDLLPSQYGDDEFMIINPTSQPYIDDTNNQVSLKDVTVSSAQSSVSINQPLSSESVANRHYITEKKYIYKYDSANQVLNRMDGTCDSGLAVPVADSIKSFSVSYFQPNLVRGGLVHIDMVMVYNEEQASYQQEVQVLNVP